MTINVIEKINKSKFFIGNQTDSLKNVHVLNHFANYILDVNFNVLKFNSFLLDNTSNFIKLLYFKYLDLLNTYVKEYYNLNDKEKANYDFKNKELIDLINGIYLTNLFISKKISLKNIQTNPLFYNDIEEIIRNTNIPIINPYPLYERLLDDEIKSNIRESFIHNFKQNYYDYFIDLRNQYINKTNNIWPYMDISLNLNVNFGMYHARDALQFKALKITPTLDFLWKKEYLEFIKNIDTLYLM